MLTKGDVGTTVYAVAKYGAMVEGNPAARLVFKHAGVWLGGVLLYLATDQFYRSFYESAYWAGETMDGIHKPLMGVRSMVVLHNLRVLVMLR